MRAHQTLIFAVLAGMSACGTDAPPVDPIEPPLEPAPPDGGQQLATNTYRLMPGEEIYMCYQFYSPEDAVAITRVDAINMPGVHHVGLFQTWGRDEDPEPHPCGDTLIKTTWLPIYGIGTSAESLQLPTGAGFVIQPRTQYVLQLHLQNPTDAPLDVRAGMNLTYAHDTAGIQPAGMYAFGTFNMEIPPNATDYQVPISNCVTGKDMNVFAVFPHMHKLGSKLTMVRTPVGGTEQPFYTIDPWAFGEQPVVKMATTIRPDDEFKLTCHYNNPTGNVVKSGESSDEEMCFFVVFYYPWDGLDGCVTGA